ncbi:hypothetical protein SRABI106_03710 [Rahnella aquatilis]|nr:hypothetical protein SRABI106_03710 [Rahnella aquatilis]
MVFIFHRREVIALIKFPQIDFVTGLRAPQAQRVGRVGVVAGNDLIIGAGDDLLGFQPAGFDAFMLHPSAETHFITGIVTLEFPRVTVFQPVIRRFFLLTVDDALRKHTVFIPDAVTAPRQRQRRQRIKETGRQSSESAVA